MAVIEDNYQEELGADETPHNETRKITVRAVGRDYRPYLTPEVELTLSGDSSFLLGMFLFTEYQVPAEYSALLNRIDHFFPHIERADLAHLRHHIQADMLHLRDLKVALDNFTGLDRPALDRGILFMASQRQRLIDLVRLS